MNSSKKLKEDLWAAACEVIEDNYLLSPPELIAQLAENEAERHRLTRMLKTSSDYLNCQIDGMQYQLLVDYTLMQAAKKNIDSTEIFSELRFKYMVNDLEKLKIRSFWEALTFVRAYVEEEI